MQKPEAGADGLASRGWIVPDWPAPAGIRAVFTTRAGGVSAPPFDSLNLGDHVRDDPAAVASNRTRLAQALGVRPVFLQQVHGTQVLTLDHATPDASVADACLSTAPDVACTVMVADCLPVLFAHRSGRVVAAAHAGWRGLAGSAEPAAQGVLETTLQALVVAVGRECSASADVSAAQVAADTVVWLGPCIGPEAFEVGGEVRDAFVASSPESAQAFREQPGGKLLANLPMLARQRLTAMGFSQVYGNDGSRPWCTVSNPGSFFSHRRDAGRLGSTGRMAACIWRV
ncbi:MAG: peptidoglycan editing factor PgeF [Hydrogenophaga sp.]|nr:peptidoglycan editing factor PgeF [Hydrogenophaga sp.]